MTDLSENELLLKQYTEVKNQIKKTCLASNRDHKGR